VVSGLLGQPARSLDGEPVGRIAELIVDVNAGRVLYVIVDGKRGYVTLPVRALEGPGTVDLALANETARTKPRADPRFRRAGRLLGQEVTYPGGDSIGTIVDIEFDRESGRVEDVVVRTAEGALNLPPSVLAQGFFPPLTRWDHEYATAEELGQRGYVRREASDERTRIAPPWGP
jgi:sporulation protein YlmC with PRC-barrel domain